LMDLGIVEDEDAERAGVCRALGHLQRVSNRTRGRECMHAPGCAPASGET
jgi:hypothetical protein